jgi:hypothetical protein
MQLTPKVVIGTARRDSKGLKVNLTCSLDCAYSVTLDTTRMARGIAVGRVTKAVVFPGAVASGPHDVTATAVATVNPGPAASAARAVDAR